MSGDFVDVTFYAQVEPRNQPGYPDTIVGAAVARLTQTKPTRPIGGTVTVKLTLRLPKKIFLPLQPEAVVMVPDTFAEATPIEVVVDDAHDPEPQDG